MKQKKWPYIISIIIGILLVSLPQFSELVSVTIQMILWWVLTIAAFFQISLLVLQKEKSIITWVLPIALFVIGFYFLFNPESALAFISWLFAALAFLSGLSSLIQSFSIKGKFKTFLILNALIWFSFALMIWSNWPESWINFIGTLLGIQLLISGITKLSYTK